MTPSPPLSLAVALRFSLVFSLLVLVCAPVDLSLAPLAAQPRIDDKRAADIILARRVLMAQIGRNMDALIGLTEPGSTFVAAEAGEHADTISAMLAVFPY